MQTRFITTSLLILFLTACSSQAPIPTQTSQPIIEPTIMELPPASTATPNVEALNLWGDKDSSVTLNRLGKGTVEAMALSPDGKTIAVMGLVSVSTYEFDSLKEIWTSLLVPVQPPVTTNLGQVVWSPDGSQMATLSEVGITVWDAKTGEQLLILKGEEYALGGSIMWTRDGKLAALNYDFGSETLRVVQTGEEIFNIETNTGAVASHFMPEKNLFAQALTNEGIVVWDTRSERQLYSPLKVCDECWVAILKLSPDGTGVAVSVSNQISVWDIKAGEKLFSVDTSMNYASIELVWSPTNEYLVGVLDYRTIMIWDAQDGSQLQMLNVPQIEDIAWSLDEEHLITLSQYEFLTVWDVKRGEPLRSLGEHTSWVLDLAWSPDGSMLASGAEDGEITIWEPTSGKNLKSFYDPKGWVRNLTWSPDGKQLATGGNNTITIWDVQTGEQVRELNLNTQAMFSLAWSPDGTMLASISYEGETILWNPFTSKQLQKLPANYGSGDLVWSPQGNLVSTGYPYTNFEGEQVTLWNPHTGETVLTYKGVHDLAWSPLGDIVASISDNGTGYGRDDTTLVLWNPQTGTEVRSFNIGTLLFHVDWSPDGKYLVVGTAQEADHALMVLDAATGEQLHQFKGHYNVIDGLAWSPRGDFIASCSADGTIILWRIESVR
jgi:WD40 repeat protein